MEASGPALAAGGHSMAAVAWWAGAYCFPGAGFALGGHVGGNPMQSLGDRQPRWGMGQGTVCSYQGMGWNS